MTAVELARATLNVLDLQQEYFRTRVTEKLQESKRAEKKLRQACEDVLHPPQNQPRLFDPEA